MRVRLYRAKTLLSKKEASTLTTRVVINNVKKSYKEFLIYNMRQFWITHSFRKCNRIVQIEFDNNRPFECLKKWRLNGTRVEDDGFCKVEFDLLYRGSIDINSAMDLCFWENTAWICQWILWNGISRESRAVDQQKQKVVISPRDWMWKILWIHDSR